VSAIFVWHFTKSCVTISRLLPHPWSSTTERDPGDRSAPEPRVYQGRRNMKRASKRIRQTTYKASVRPTLECTSPVGVTCLGLLHIRYQQHIVTAKKYNSCKKAWQQAVRWLLYHYCQTASSDLRLDDLYCSDQLWNPEERTPHWSSGPTNSTRSSSGSTPSTGHHSTVAEWPLFI